MKINSEYYIGKITVESQKLENILERLSKAQNEIYNCYQELGELGFIEFKHVLAASDSEDK